MTETMLYLTTVLTAGAVVMHWVIVFGLGFRIILKRRPTGVSLAWLLVVVTLPFFGAVLYLFVGEVWLPRRRIQRYTAYRESNQDQVFQIDQAWDIKGEDLPALAWGLNAQVSSPTKISAIGGNSIELFDTSAGCLRAVVKDIDEAESSVSMLFYIWQSGGDVDLVEQALVRAAQRGVDCRVMVDCAGSKRFIRKRSAQPMINGGVRVVNTLPAGIFRALLARIDIRNHRKIISIDHKIAYTGSMNMVDPSCFKADKRFGQWVDVMARVQGPAARVLDMTVRLDWAVESQDEPSEECEIGTTHGAGEAFGEVALQVVPSGPDQSSDVIHDMLLTLIYSARERLVITTPYFIPSEAMQRALTGASQRGVRVTIVVPEKIDSILVRHASKSYFEDLLEAGVEIWAYQGGLLHAKTVIADDDVAMLGTVNMDKRSFWINFEISVFAYDRRVVDDLGALQQRYIDRARRIDAQRWSQRSIVSRVIQNSVQLLSPIL